MHVSKPTAVFLLLATLVPLAYVAFFIMTMFFAVLSETQGGPEPKLFKIIFVLHFICMFWLWALLAFYVAYVFKSPAVPKDQKVLWVVILVFFNMFAMPLFWYLYIWRQHESDVGPPPSAL